jgi:predicted amidohydrolase YtcJ
MLADFVVLERDPLTTAPEELAEIDVAQTWVGATPVYQAGGG